MSQPQATQSYAQANMAKQTALLEHLFPSTLTKPTCQAIKDSIKQGLDLDAAVKHVLSLDDQSRYFDTVKLITAECNIEVLKVLSACRQALAALEVDTDKEKARIKERYAEKEKCVAMEEERTAIPDQAWTTYINDVYKVEQEYKQASDAVWIEYRRAIVPIWEAYKSSKVNVFYLLMLGGANTPKEDK